MAYAVGPYFHQSRPDKTLSYKTDDGLFHHHGSGSLVTQGSRLRAIGVVVNKPQAVAWIEAGNCDARRPPALFLTVVPVAHDFLLAAFKSHKVCTKLQWAVRGAIDPV